jgi:hypothetical protein
MVDALAGAVCTVLSRVTEKDTNGFGHLRFGTDVVLFPGFGSVPVRCGRWPNPRGIDRERERSPEAI